MPEELESADVPARTSGAASMLATAALLKVQRRWTGGGVPGPVYEGALPGAPGARFVMPAVHLEDPEWSRAVLGLISRAEPALLPATTLVLRSDRVDVGFLGAVGAAAPPFETSSGDRWSLARRSGTLAELPSTPTIVAASRRAGLVTAWSTEDSRCLLDIVGCGSVALDGPPVAVGATLSDVVVELATRRWCDLDELVVVGFGSEIAGLERVTCLPDIDLAARYLVASPPRSEGSPRARCLVVAPPIGRREQASLNPLRSLVELVHAMPQCGLICCDTSLASIHCTWRLSSHRSTLDLSFRRRSRPSIVMRPDPLPDDEPTERPGSIDDRAEGSGGTEAAPPISLPRQPERPSDLIAEPALARKSPPTETAAQGVTVRILGPVDVKGLATSFDRRPRVTELVVYLALHRDGCSGDAMSAAIWPDRRVPVQTLSNRLSEVRQALGDTSTGEPRLRRVSGRHVLAADVRTDWEDFQELSGTGTDPQQWRRALELVRGRPFEGLPESGWALLEGFVPSMEGRVVEVACRLASRCLDAGDATRAEWAVRKGLLTSPWDERLYRMLMVVSHAVGNRGGIESALRSLAHVLDWRGDPLEAVHSETAQLYRQLVVDRALG